MPKERKLLFSVTAKDCDWDYYRGSGAGGQKRNKTSNAVRCTHKDSKAVGKAEDTRSQLQNKIVLLSLFLEVFLLLKQQYLLIIQFFYQ